MKIILNIFFVLISNFIFSQKNSTVTISGKVYISSSRSQGIVNGKTYSEPQQPFKFQIIIFDNDTTQIQTQTDSLGAYSILIKPGTYNVYQGQAPKEKKSGTMNYGSYGLTVKESGSNYDIHFNNTVNGRSAMMNNNSKNQGKPTKTKK